MLSQKKLKTLIEKNGLLIGILILTIAVKLLYINTNQALWWDESTYLVKAKNWLYGTPDTGWWAGRTFIFPLMLLPSLGNEFMAKLIGIGFATSIVFLTYKIGKIVFNRDVALIGSSMVAVSWMFNFYGVRVLTGIPSTALAMLAVLFFLKKDENKHYPLLMGASIALATIIRFAAIVVALPLLLHQLLNKERKIKNYSWTLFALCFFMILPLYDVLVYGNPLESIQEFFAFNVAGPGTGVEPFWYFFAGMPHLMGELLELTTIIPGFGFLGSLLVSPTLLLTLLGLAASLKQVKKKKVFFFLAVITTFFLAFSLIQHKEDRFMMYVLPYFFLLTGLGIKQVGQLFADKQTRKIVVIACLAIVFYSNLSYGHSLITSKGPSYAQVSQAGEWIKQNSLPGQVVVSASIPQNTFYSERTTLNFPETLEGLKNLLEDESVKFIVVSVFETHPEYAYTLNLSVAKTYTQSYQDRVSPLLIIYNNAQ